MKWKADGEPREGSWQTSKYTWYGFISKWKRTVGDIEETRTVKHPMKRVIRNRSRYIPAGQYRNVT